MANLKLDNVCYRYKKGTNDVLKGVSCSFDSGGIYAIIGPSGSGKTTLLSIMAGLDSPSRGEVFIDGDPLSSFNLDRYRRERVAIIFQAFHLFPLLTVVENVCYPMELNGLSKPKAVKRAQELLNSVGIGEDKYRRYPSHLSGGEQQRVAIARALATGAKVILADEPTGNLDKANGDNIIEILKRLAHEMNFCVIVVTHDHAIAEASDTVYKMSDGELVEAV